MSIKRFITLAACAVTCAMLPACHSSSHHESQTPPPTDTTSMMLSTPQVLAKAQVTSEVDDPLPVNNGAITLTDAAEDTADPATVNQ